jgi:hypothetical protein
MWGLRAGRCVEIAARALLGFLTVAALVCLVIGCGRKTDRVATLRTDPMAAPELAGSTTVRVTESEGSTSVKSAPAKIRTTFTVEPGLTPDALAELAGTARSAGWTLEEARVLGFRGEKRIDGLLAQLAIDGVEAENTVWVEISTHSE